LQIDESIFGVFSILIRLNVKFDFNFNERKKRIGGVEGRGG
jgi:hypothetical protein